MYNIARVLEINPDVRDALRSLYAKAFPDEDLFPLVLELFEDKENVFSFVAYLDKKIIGHVAYTKCWIDGKGEVLSMLAPLAVMPENQRKGVGSLLVKEGFKYLRGVNITTILVLGDPEYYQRFGFEKESKIITPYKIPEEWSGAWQSVNLDDKEKSIKGNLLVTKPWQKKELWSA